MTKTSNDRWSETRRFRALELIAQGWKQCEVAEALGVTGGAVSQWASRFREGGIDALRTRYSPGRPPRLSASQKESLPGLLERGPAAYGFEGELWTRERVGAVIRSEFGVELRRVRIGQILAECGWTRQKPERRAKQRDEAAIERWRAEKWPELKK